MLAILDYKAGNQTSVLRALRALGVPAEITADPSTILSAEGVIFPGVGAAGQAMAQLTSTGMDKVLREAVAMEKPLLGICLGCQILLEHSEENDTRSEERRGEKECRSRWSPNHSARRLPPLPAGMEGRRGTHTHSAHGLEYP